MNDRVVLDGDISLNIDTPVGGLDNVLDGKAGVITTVKGDLSLEAETPSCSLENILDGEAGVITTVQTGQFPAYTGPTEITPSTEQQILNTDMKSVLGNIIINPVPDNYGLITWNGSTLTVS